MVQRLLLELLLGLLLVVTFPEESDGYKGTDGGERRQDRELEERSLLHVSTGTYGSDCWNALRHDVAGRS
uniref:RxLR effector candidate protein n=1 Tax=Hyaloperonospora arabidopsidis (strain Emoy2) TaxID=559515 RepID=M4BL51_HYAAE